KGHLKKRAEGRAYVYSPAQPKSQVIRNLVTDFLGRVFQGSAEPLLLHLLQNQDLSAEDLEKARRAAQAAEEEGR
ncbi:MAG: BlaI/MecI/CopY family transcriptional regulator, partial [Acidobacteriota bacterium]